jgi:HPt (histidine-containing phosphotransfer) domain-containing protein
VESFKRAGMSDHIGKPFEPRELRRLINRLVGTNANAPNDQTTTASPPLAPDESTVSQLDNVLKEDVFGALAEMIGSEKAADLARKFAMDLDNRFADLTDQKSLRSDAHIIASSAGAIGFADLSSTARKLEHACDRAEDLHEHIQDLIEKRRLASEFIQKRFGQ